MNIPANALTHSTAATPALDVLDAAPDWGTMNRELLAEKLAAAYWNGPVKLSDKPSGVITSWLAAADVAITELQGAS
jgi:hypothetical protein